MNFDGSNVQEVELGGNASYTQLALSPNDMWLYYVKREQGKESIWRNSLDSGQKELVLKISGYSAHFFINLCRWKTSCILVCR